MTREHTDREYESELQQVRDQILLMGAKVEEMIAGSVRALVERDSGLARAMIAFDDQIDRLEIDTDNLCLRILARRQPVASDLRFLTIALKLVTDLERIGDLGESICERVIELNTEPPLKPYLDLPLMAEAVQGMVREALDAFVARDAERAQQVIEKDSVVDAFYAQIFRELLTYMLEDPRNISRAIRVQSIGKHLERIGDHATNLAELVVFMVRGKDPRHPGRAEDAARRMPHGVLFLCVHNSARSQMAEGWARKLTRVRVWSAGSDPAAAVHPLAVRVMQEVGIDISRQRPKSIKDVPLGDIDTVITLCAEEVCPLSPGALRLDRWELPDPAAVSGDEEMAAAFRRVRDELRGHIERLARQRS
jgi:phosphate transport system protein